ncbi:MAG: hypothetical protein GT601_17585 [Acidaminobacter sp.]|uniref:hypothetical protein n=1 Tax=Acidaminobacter sp. TaxID=1872102 RepID=UPI00138164D2|nr:hypothetical protein [Acidaminobacter sp.]MZQ99482.1 hypothetical protein [Acidaminobacter sp.]
MIRPVTRLPRQNPPLSIRQFLGVDVTGTRDVRRSPAMMNCVLDDEGTPEMRTGYEKLFATSLGAGAILGIHKWIDTDSTTIRIIHHGTKLYIYDTLGEQPVEAYSGMAASKSISFMLATKLCILDGTNFIVFNGTTFVTAESIAYIPTFLIGTPPGGGGTRVEDLNLLQPRFKQKFSTVAATKTYQIHGAPLDALEFVWLNGALKTVTTDYSVNLTTGVLTLVADPGAGTNNLEVQVKKDSYADASRIKKCHVAHVYGGPNDSRVFVTGNPDYPHIDWWTGLPLSGAYDPTYWPDTNFDRIGGDTDPVVGYAVQYDRMVVLKRRSVYLRNWSIEEDAYGRTVTHFPSVPLSRERGAYSAGSIQILNNNPVFLSDEGVYEVVGTNVRDERNVSPISSLTGIKAVGVGEGIDYKGKYYLATTGGTVWVCDYNTFVQDEATGRYQPVWYPWDNLPVNVWAEDGDLLFGSNDRGMVYRVKPKDGSDLYPYNDDGAVINAYFSSIITTFERDDQTKLVQSLIIGMKPWNQAKLAVEYATEEGSSGVVHTERMDLFDYGVVDYGDWSYDTNRTVRAFKVRVDDARNIQRFQVRLTSSGVINEFFGFSSIDITYQNLSEVR